MKLNMYTVRRKDNMLYLFKFWQMKSLFGMIMLKLNGNDRRIITVSNSQVPVSSEITRHGCWMGRYSNFYQGNCLGMGSYGCIKRPEGQETQRASYCLTP